MDSSQTSVQVRPIGNRNGYLLHEAIRGGAVYASKDGKTPLGVAWGPAADRSGNWFASRGEMAAVRLDDREAALDHITADQSAQETTVGNKLQLERRDQAEGGHLGGGVMMTPAVGEDYWSYRVRLTDKQAIVGFPKFMTTGIGFAVEEDWNTNFPYTVDAEAIYEHIKHNAGDDAITREMCIDAIRLIQEAVIADGGYRPATREA